MSIRVGVLTGGGDAPGLNAAVCGLGRRLRASGCTLIGFRDGWRGIIENDTVDLGKEEFHHLLVHGGTLLGSSSANPYRNPEIMVPKTKATFAAHRLDALVAIGGEGTLGAAERLHREERMPVVGIPKTIDNDLEGTDFTFGFFSAVEVATRAMDDLRTTAEAHGRVMVVECMGRHAGWITAYAGVAAAAEAILVPERHVHIEELCANLQKVRNAGRRAAIVAAAEGARIYQDGTCLSSSETDEFGAFRTGGVAEMVARLIQLRMGWEARHLVLGHLQRAGRPIAFDRIFALRLGARAARLVLEHRFGMMAALRNGEVIEVPLAAAVAQRKTLSGAFLDRYESFFLPISSPT
jgi:6-phosphofructokinase 1